MSKVLGAGNVHVVQFGKPGGTRSLAQILEDEQGRVVTVCNSADLLRVLINRMDIMAFDEEVAILRVFIPLRELEQLELWGAGAEDCECDGLW